MQCYVKGIAGAEAVAKWITEHPTIEVISITQYHSYFNIFYARHTIAESRATQNETNCDKNRFSQ